MAEAGTGRLERRIDVLSTVLLAVAAVATAWATFQSAYWRSEQALAGNRSTAARVEATKTSGVANRQIQIDVQTFVQWADAYASGDRVLTDFYFDRFRPEFRPAVDAWIATEPLQNPDAPLTPFVMPEYAPAALAETERLEQAAEAESAEARAHVERADRYALCVVLFATCLFFAGISTRLRGDRSRAVVLGLGCALFLLGLGWIVTFPVGIRL
ncbi:MAG: hypothetical protein ACRDNI_06665 [Gaiellaceae bacterium]